uniref:Uncharacterized protein n=1 Tax=Tanacetum cinerariifolium TaxID=118510 RepID=A0A6L2PAV8_TANCI|nr:hypothetical protein [Tanacetum cinerariifolium]
MEEVSLNVDEAKLKKINDEILRQRCTSGDEHQYHIDQMKNFLKKSSCKDLLHKETERAWKTKGSDLFEFKYHSSYQDILKLGHEHKFITEIIARRVNDCIVSITEPNFKNLNKNDIKDMYLLIMNGKVPNYAKIRLLWSLSVFIRSLVIWERVHDFQLGIKSYQHKVNLTAPIISFARFEEFEMLSIIYEPVHGIIYKNSKKEKRVMRHSYIHKFCDATLNRVLEGLKSYNNDVRLCMIQDKQDLPIFNDLTRFSSDLVVQQLIVPGDVHGCNLGELVYPIAKLDEKLLLLLSLDIPLGLILLAPSVA